MVFCRFERGYRVTGGKILYVNKRRHGQSSSRNSHLKRVHLLFDEDGNAVDADSEGSTVTEMVKAFPEAGEQESVNEATSVPPLSSAEEAVEDYSEAVCSNEEQTSCSYDTISTVVPVNSAECCSSLTVDATGACSTCEDNTEEAAAESERCIDEVNKENGDAVRASSDPDISKYWWQRYRLFSRFDRGIMIDRGLLFCCYCM